MENSTPNSENEETHIGGVSMAALASTYGTPVHVYDSAVVARQVQRSRTAFNGIPFRILYACKPLPNMSVLRLLHKLGTGLDVVPIEEVELGLRAGFLPDEILFTPNTKTSTSFFISEGRDWIFTKRSVLDIT